ncbi:MAG: hypothetical protein Q7R52_02335 [archaeon]|nr:hypothetical protein [archaeon]
MQSKFLKEVIDVVVGKQAEKISDLLDRKDYISEFIIAKKLDLTINQTRNILYKLSDFGLVSSTRKKDKKKGWYTYFWKIEPIKVLEFLRNMIEKNMEQLNHQIKSRETKLFYVCDRCSVEYNEENALYHDFTCQECGNIFTVKDNSKVINEMKKNLFSQERELDLILKDLEEEKRINEKDKQRKDKREEKKKEKGKKKIRDERKKIRDENKKNIVKKVVKKIVKKSKKKKIKKKKR